MVGMRLAGSDHRVVRSVPPSEQYLDDSWQKTTRRYEKPGVQDTKRQGSEAGRVAIVIDDLGPNLQYARRLTGLDPSMTFAVIPWQVHSKEIVQLATSLGMEVILHQPMEARQHQGDGMPGMLYTSMTDREIMDTLSANLDAYSGIAGINNHMGSAFTEDARALGVVFEVLKEKGLYFLDSRTTDRTVGRKLGRLHELPVFERDVFLDNESDDEYMTGMWARFLREAGANGHAVLIAHGRLESIEFLEARLPELKGERLRLLPLSALYTGNPDT